MVEIKLATSLRRGSDYKEAHSSLRVEIVEILLLLPNQGTSSLADILY